MERIQLHEGHAAEVSLLLLDPGLRLPDLIDALRQKRGWQARRCPALHIWLNDHVQGAACPEKCGQHALRPLAEAQQVSCLQR